MVNQISKLNNQKQNSKVKTDFRERCYNYSITIIRFIDGLPGKQASRTISDQILRSATSIGANLVEAKSASSKRDYIKYFEIALKSANETKYWLGLLRDALGINETDINKLLKEASEISNILASSLITMKERKNV